MPEFIQSRRSRFAVADAVIAAGLLTLTFLFGCFRQKDADIWWHLKTGQMIIERGELPQKDWFTFTSTDRDWIDLHWLFQITAAKLYSLGGMELLTLMSASLGALAVSVLLAARRSGWSWSVTIACWFPVVFLLCGRMYVRPEVVTLVCMSIFLTVLFHANDRSRLLWALVPVQILWVNVQGLFILGIVLAGFYWIEGAWFRLRRRPESRLGRRSAILMALTGVSLFNPYHFRGLLFPIELFRKMSWDADFYSKHISELQSIPQFIAQNDVWNFYILLHLGLGALATASFLFMWSRRRFDLFRLMTFAVFAWLGLQATRNSGQFALVVGAVTAWNFGEWFAVRGERRKADEEKQRIEDRRLRIEDRTPVLPAGYNPVSSILYPLASRIALALIVISAAWSVVSGRFYALAGEGRLFGLGEHPLWHAHGAARFAAQLGMPDRILAFHLGHAAVFEFHKSAEQRTFCDPRLEVVSRELLQEYHEIEEAIRTNRPGWKRVLGRHDLRMLLVDHRGDFVVEATLLTDPDWRCVYFDPVAAVFVHEETAESLNIPAVGFAARHFRIARTAPTFPRLKKIEARFSLMIPAPDQPAVSEPQEDFIQAEALFNIARALHERTPLHTALARSLALLAFDHARVGAAQFPRSIDGWRSIGLNLLLLASDSIPTDDAIGTDELHWDPITMLDIARARYYLQEACVIDMTDFPTLFALFGIAGIQKDRVAQHGYGTQLLGVRARSPRERAMQQQLRKQLEILERHIDFDNLIVGFYSQNARDTDELQTKIEGHFATGRMDIAVNEFAGFIRMHGNLPWSLADCYAGLLMRTGYPMRARKVWQEQVTGDFDEGLRLERIASTYLALGEYGEAIEQYQAALKLSPRLVEARWGLARCYLETGDAVGLSGEHTLVLVQGELTPAARSAFEWMNELADQLFKRSD